MNILFFPVLCRKLSQWSVIFMSVFMYDESQRTIIGKVIFLVKCNKSVVSHSV